MKDQSKKFAVPGQKYNNGELIAVESFSGCFGCAANADDKLCNELPLCSSEKISIIFIKNDET